MIRLRVVLPALLFAVVSFTLDAGAAQIYQWKDADGVTHFADNPMAVPSKYRQKGVRDVEPLQGLSQGANVSTTAMSSSGAKLWHEKCMECHTVARQDTDGKKSLFRFIIDPVSRYPISMEDLIGQLEYATSGRTTDMDPVDLSKEQLQAIAAYLRDSVR